MRNISLLTLLLFLLFGTYPATAQHADLSGKVIKSVAENAAEQITEDQWYLMYCRGRDGYMKETGNSLVTSNSDVPTAGSSTSDAAVYAYLVRFVPAAANGQYYLQTGTGHYFGALVNGLNSGAGGSIGSPTSEPQTYYTYATIGNNAGHFYLNDQNGVILDANSLGSSLAGWGTGRVSTTEGNNDWAFYQVTVSEAGELQGEEWLKYTTAGGKLFRIANKNYTNRFITQSGGKLVCSAKSDDNLSQIWIVTSNSDGYTIRNAGNGEYVQPQNSLYTPYTTSLSPATLYVKLSSQTTSNQDYFSISNESGATGYKFLHQDSQSNVVPWAESAAASAWAFVSVENITPEEVKSHLNETLGHAQPAQGVYFRIINHNYGTAMSENFVENKATCKAIDPTDYAQLWTLESNGSNYAIKNALTEEYIQSQTSGSSYSQPYKTGSTAGYFSFSAIDGEWTDIFTIADLTKRDNGSAGLHCDASANVVSWYTSDSSPSVWYLVAVDIDEAGLAAARETYQNSSSFIANVDKYATEVSNFFADQACTELKAEYQDMSDAQLTSAMGSLPATIVEMALKVKNNSWTTYAGWDKTERTYRVAAYKPYSDYSKWSYDIIKTGYYFGRLSNPTGISAKAGDIITIYVDDDIPQGTELAVEAVHGTANTGTTTNLHKGLNAILCAEDANLFVFYNITDTGKEIASLPEIKIHIEGGTVNGYFDLTKGDTDTDWNKLQTHLLKGSDVVNLKAENIVFCMKRDLVTAACPAQMTELLGIWDNIINLQHGLMGIEEYAGRFNCILNAFTVDYNYMFATNYGTYYEESTISSVMNYESMKTSESIWGPAHENGHIHQRLINMVNCTEVSNNLFSNAAVYDQGYMTSRTDPLSTTFGNFSKGVFWADHGIWETTRLYWQLYLYYHVQGHNPDFYPSLFRALRKDPMTHSTNTVINATDDYLKFALKCCEAAGEDLTELFEAYGFFVIPEQTTSFNGVNCKMYDDYGNYYLHVDQAMIDKTKAAMKACGKPMGNILFIDDRIEPTESAGGGNRRKFDGGTISFSKHEFGETGQYTDFTADNTCEGYQYTVSTSGKVTVGGGTGAVGFKVYDKDGNLIFLSNTSTFTLPAGTDLESIVVKAAGGNGEDAIARNSADKAYTLRVYNGSETAETVSVTGKGDLPALQGNAIAVIEDTDAPETLKNAVNFIETLADGSHRAARLELTDGESFYAPCDFTATSLTYSRADAAGTISLCLPFAVSAADFESGTTLGLPSTLTKDADGTSTVRFAPVGEIAAGVPFIAECPEAQTVWSLNKDNVQITGSCSPGSVSTTDGAATMRGSFANMAAAAGTFHLNLAGTLFEQDGTETLPAFRACIEADAAAFGTSLRVLLDESSVSGIEGLPATAEEARPVYDLQGRRVAQPVKGGVYIVNGKKIIK